MLICGTCGAPLELRAHVAHGMGEALVWTCPNKHKPLHSQETRLRGINHQAYGTLIRAQFTHGADGRARCKHCPGSVKSGNEADHLRHVHPDVLDSCREQARKHDENQDPKESALA